MSIDYKTLPRLAELCERVTDETLTIKFKFNGDANNDSYIDLEIFSKSTGRLTCTYFTSSTVFRNRQTIEEMIAMLEQIQAFEFRDDDEEVAA